MNKARRHELKMLKYKRRINVLAAKSSSVKAYLKGDVINVNCFALRTTGKPCSCFMCSPYKYCRAKEAIKKRNHITEVHEMIFETIP